MHARTLVAGGLLALATVGPASAVTLQYAAGLSGPAESPPNASPGTGSALVTIDTDLETMRVQASFDGLLGTTTIAHIHCCTGLPDEGTVAPATTVPTFPGFPTGVTTGSYDRIFDMGDATSYNAAFVTANGGTPASAFAAFVAGLDGERAYFNVHSTVFGGGEIRGFLHAVPEPSVVALLGLGIAALAFRPRVRRTAAC